MKVTVGNTLGITLTSIPYSPIKVETTFLIEKNIGKELEGEELDNYLEELRDKVEKVVYSDLEKKVKDLAEKQKVLKRKIEGKLWEKKG